VLTLAISTTISRIEIAKELAKSLVSLNNEILLIVQGAIETQVIKCKDYEIFFLQGYGLSKSRNFAINKASMPYIWLLDDDVSMVNTQLVEDVLANNNNDIFIGQIFCSDKKGYYKDYERKNNILKLSLLRVSSIELVIKKEFIKENNIFFDESIGLGTCFPSGEENVFLLDCLNRGANYYWINQPIISHPCLLPNKSPIEYWSKRGIVESKAIVASNLGVLGIPILALWSFKILKSGVGVKFVWLMLLKYFRG